MTLAMVQSRITIFGVRAFRALAKWGIFLGIISNKKCCSFAAVFNLQTVLTNCQDSFNGANRIRTCDLLHAMQGRLTNGQTPKSNSSRARDKRSLRIPRYFSVVFKLECPAISIISLDLMPSLSKVNPVLRKS